MQSKKKPQGRQTPSALQAAQLTECIRKEERLLAMRHGTPVGRASQSGFRVVLKTPVPDRTAEGLLEKPSSIADTKSLTAGMSVSLWSSINPGYILQEPRNISSIASRDYKWNEEEVEYIRQHDSVGSKFHRRWDDQSRYNEAAAMHRQVMKGFAEQAAGAAKAS